MKSSRFKGFCVLAVLLAGALAASCSSGDASIGVEPGVAPPAALVAQAALADELHLEVESVTIVETEAVDWPDACLGIETEGVACAQVITPGYRVMLEAEGQLYEVHTNEDGSHWEILADIAG